MTREEVDAADIAVLITLWRVKWGDTWTIATRDAAFEDPTWHAIYKRLTREDLIGFNRPGFIFNFNRAAYKALNKEK